MDKLLEKIGWSQAYFAKRIGVSEKTVCQWNKKGAPEYALAYLRQIARLISE